MSPELAAAYGYGTEGEPPPETLPYEPGAPIPPGYHQEEDIRKGLVVAGAVTAGSLWLLSALIGGAAQGLQDEFGSEDCTYNGSIYSCHKEDKAYWPLVIPLVGPFITIGTVGTNDLEGPGTFMLILDGVAQGGGLAMLIAGVVAKRDVLVWDGMSPGQQGTRISLVPAVVGPNSLGVGLNGLF
jgi:hypothetical protein